MGAESGIEEVTPWLNSDLANLGDILDYGIISSAVQQILNQMNTTNNLVSVVTFVDPDTPDPTNTKDTQLVAWMGTYPNYTIKNIISTVIGDGTARPQYTVLYTGEAVGG